MLFTAFGGAAIKIAAACLFGAIWIPLMFALGYKHGLNDGLKNLRKDKEDKEP